MNLIPNVNSKVYTTSAFIIGIILADDATPAEQNSLGNWFMLIGQVLCTNSSQQQVLNNRNGSSNISNKHIINDNNSQINIINKVIKGMQEGIEELKKNH